MKRTIIKIDVGIISDRAADFVIRHVNFRDKIPFDPVYVAGQMEHESPPFAYGDISNVLNCVTTIELK